MTILADDWKYVGKKINDSDHYIFGLGKGQIVVPFIKVKNNDKWERSGF